MNILKGMKVVDFSHAYSGPFCTMNLADYGAEVIKIERAGSGDQARYWAPFKNDYSTYYGGFNRGKKSLTLNIRSEEGKQIIFDLVKEADVVISNFKAGTLDRYGMGYEEMKKINPSIIFVVLSGFGEVGQSKSYPAYDNVMQGMSGLMELNGMADNEPTKLGPAVGDSYSGLILMLGTLMAYYNKLRTGEGQKVDATMLGGLISTMEPAVLDYAVNGNVMQRRGNTNPFYAPCDVYKCMDGFLAVSAKNDEQWQAVCDIFELADMKEDPKFATNEARMQNIPELTDRIEKFLSDKGMYFMEKALNEAGVPASHVMNIVEAMDDEHLKARKMVIEVEDPIAGKIGLVGNPIKMTGCEPSTAIPSPTLGQHTDEVLKSIGYSDEKIAELKENGIV